MATKTLKTRVINKHETEANWRAATGFTPLEGELIIYDPDSNYPYARFKVGDGKTNVNDLPFTDANKVGKSTNDQGAEIFNNYTNNQATGEYSHAEGNSTKAISSNSHAEGARTKAGTKAFKIIALSGTVGGAGTYSLDSTVGIQPGMRYSAVTSVAAYNCGEITAIDGNMVRVNNYPGHGINTEVDNSSDFDLYNLFIIVDHPELGTINAGFNAHTEGSNTHAAQVDAHAEGRNTRALGKYSHTEGISTQAGHAAHAEGSETKAMGVVAHAEGAETVAQGNYTHAEGFQSQAIGGHSHAEGQQTKSTGTAAHSEGGITVASGDYSHAEGGQTTAQGAQSHSEGYLTKAIGQQSHAEGYNTQAIGNRSHAGGRDTVANYNDQFVIGRYNSNKVDTLFEVGNGSANGRANAFEVKTDNSAYVGSQKLATETFATNEANRIKSEILGGATEEELNTLKELSDALNDDENFAATVVQQIGEKVDKVDGKGLSTNDFTDSDKSKLDNMPSPLVIATNSYVEQAVVNKVDKVEGKGLSTNDFTDAYKTKIDNIDYPVDSVNGKTGNVTLSATDITEFGYLKTHPENSNSTIIPYLNNDLAFLTKKGGSVNYYSTTATDFTPVDLEQQSLVINEFDNVFDGTSSYALVQKGNATTVVIDLQLAERLYYNNKFYIDFGVDIWGARSIVIYAMDSDSDSNYNLLQSTTSPMCNGTFWYCNCTNNANVNGDGRFDKLRIVLSNFNGDSPRIAEIGIINYNSKGTQNTFVSRGGCNGMYGDLLPHYDNQIDLGHEWKKWRNVYTNKINNKGTVTSSDSTPMEIVASGTQPTPVPGKTIIWIDTSQSVLNAAEEVEF